MVIAIAASENNLTALVDPHFGRCPCFYLFDSEINSGLFLDNPASLNHEKAGCDIATLLIEKEVAIIVAGRFGIKVVDLLRKNNIQMIIPQVQQSVGQIINQLI